jgi:uncharacterized damage-inducible protein DinB
MADFAGEDLQGSRFERIDLSGSRFRACALNDSRFRGTDFHNVTMSGVELVDVTITGDVENVTVNGVDIGPLVDRRYPDRAKMRPVDPSGFRQAWDILERLWGETVTRARKLDPPLLHASVDDEWSFTETLRHLVFATDAWLRRAILGDPAPWDPLSLPWDESPDIPGIPRDREARPSLETVLALRRDRMAGVRVFLDGLTAEKLQSHTTPVAGPGWPQSRSYTVRRCLLTILHEEWHHRLFAERDLTALEAGAA